MHIHPLLLTGHLGRLTEQFCSLFGIGHMHYIEEFRFLVQTSVADVPLGVPTFSPKNRVHLSGILLASCSHPLAACALRLSAFLFCA